MSHALHRLAFGVALVLTVSACQPAANGAPAAAATPEASTGSALPSLLGDIRVTEVATGLDHPWAVAILPDDSFLVTERSGSIRRVGANGGVSEPLAGVPAVHARGQGGLLDLVPSPDFINDKRIYFSYSEPDGSGLAGTTVAHAVLGDSGLDQVTVIYRQEPKLQHDNHFGSRLAFDGQGHLFISQGDRTERIFAQHLDKLQGKVVRLNLDGSIPADNPFVGQADARPEIWSYGHRNSQGLAIDPRTGKLWETEHGPRGGDEINLPQPGKNYGWPLITHGINYSGQPIPEAVGREKEGLEPPYHVWEKSPGLSGLAFYTGRPGATWNDSLFLGSLAERNLIRLTLDGDNIVSEERLLGSVGERIRDVRVGADGNVYVVTDEDNGKLLRIEPPKAP